MSKSMTQTVNMLYDLIKRDKKRGYDTTATITRVEDGTAWIHIPGGVDETPAKLTINAKAGDTVQVRVANGRAFLVGNASAPPTDNTVANQAVERIVKTAKAVEFVQKAVEVVTRIAGNTAQYFWFTETGTDTGAHITEIPQEQFLEDPENGGGNLLARSNGVAVRDGLTELAQFSADGVVINRDGLPAFEVSATGTSEVVTSVTTKLMSDPGTYTVVFSVPAATSEITGISLIGITPFVPISLTYGTASSGQGWETGYEYDGDRTILVTLMDTSSGGHAVSVRVTATINTPYFTVGLRRGTKAPFSAVIGRDLIASQSDQTVIGRYNEEDTGGDYVFVAGAGTSDSNRANAIAFGWNGEITTKGTSTTATRTSSATAGTLTLYRNGNLVTASGSLTIGAIGTTYTTLATIPDGFRPVAIMYVTDAAGGTYRVRGNGDFDGRNLTAGTKYFGFCYVCG